MKRLKVAATIAATIVFLWAVIIFVDYGRVVKGDYPVFCINNDGYYQGLGYSYDIYPHPITGKVEYCFYLFGQEIESTFTN